MNTKFTKGEWNVTTHKNIATGSVSHAINRIDGCLTMEQGINNAHLIAAAPDMYAMLEALKWVLFAIGNGVSLETSQVDALLAKARGEL
jgi:cytochrome c